MLSSMYAKTYAKYRGSNNIFIAAFSRMWYDFVFHASGDMKSRGQIHQLDSRQGTIWKTFEPLELSIATWVKAFRVATGHHVKKEMKAPVGSSM